MFSDKSKVIFVVKEFVYEVSLAYTSSATHDYKF